MIALHAALAALLLAAAPPAQSPAQSPAPSPASAPSTPPAGAAPAQPAAEEAPLPAAPDARPSGEPPPGAPADQKLWRSVQLGTAQAAYQMARVAQCAHRIRYARYYQELDARIAEPASAEAARPWRSRLEAAALAAEAALPKDGGRVRACRYVLVDLEAWMEHPEEPRAKERLPAARAAAQACATGMERLLQGLTPEAERLEATLAEVDRFLGRAPPAVPAPPQAAPAAEGSAR